MATNKFQPLDGKTWRKSFKLKGEKFDIELSKTEIYEINCSLALMASKLSKEKRYPELKSIEKLYKEFSGFWDMALHLS